MRTCQADGAWSGTEPTCSGGMCRALATLGNADPWSYTYDGQPETVGSDALCRTVASAQCKDCFFFNSSQHSTLMCDSVRGKGPYAGQLLFVDEASNSPVLPVCAPYPNHCHKNHLQVQSLANGLITSSDGQSVADLSGTEGFGCGTVLTYSCNSCYQLKVAGVLQPLGAMHNTTCKLYTTTGEYTDASEVSCVLAACPSTTMPHGTAQLASGLANQCGATYNFQCDTCYQRVGNFTAECQTSSSTEIWSPNMASCQPAVCGTLGVTDGAVSYAGSSCNSKATVTCDSCYEYSGGTSTDFTCGVKVCSTRNMHAA